jgi:hypothetical protein
VGPGAPGYARRVMVSARRLCVASAAALVLGLLGACSTTGTPPSVGEKAEAGEAFSACQVQGYESEFDGGGCPQGTCAVLAFDTNGALLPCCTSVVSGPGLCVDAGAIDASEAGDGGATDGDATVAADAADASDGSDAGDTSVEGSTDASSEAGDAGAGEGSLIADGGG